jgi:hypothetical protein
MPLTAIANSGRLLLKRGDFSLSSVTHSPSVGLALGQVYVYTINNREERVIERWRGGGS